MELGWYDTYKGKTEVEEENPVPVPSEIPYGLAWDRTRTSAVRDQTTYCRRGQFPRRCASFAVREALKFGVTGLTCG
jgi:hypothetical protein